MNEEHYISLIEKELSGEITQEELSALKQWKQEDEDNRLLAEQLKRAWDVSDQYGQDLKIDLEGDYASVQKKIHSDRSRIVPLRRLLWLAVAASIILIASFIFLMPSNDVQKITATSDNYVVNLPDGSTVELSEGSSVSYANDFVDERKLNLEGSGFLDILHTEDDNLFVIHSPQMVVTVLGTTFIMRDVPDVGMAEVQLIEGRVSVDFPGHQEDIRIQTGESVRLMDREVSRYANLRLNEIPWFDLDLSYEDALCDDIVRDIKQFYGVDIEINEELRSCLLTADFTKLEVEEIVSMISSVFDAEYAKDGYRYIISGGQCD